MQIERPRFESVPLAKGLNWRAGEGWLYEEKMDGRWSVEQAANSIICGERMKDGRFIAFDVVKHEGQDVRKLPLRSRLAILDSIRHPFTGEKLHRPARGSGGEFLEAVLSRGGEGVVAKSLDAPFGAEWFKCKRIETFDLIVTEKAVGKMSIRVGELSGEDRGWCPCFSGYENIRVGEIVEISAYSLTAKGKLREPRFVRTRPDKQQ